MRRSTQSFLSFLFFLLFLSYAKVSGAATYYVALTGADTNPGTIDRPFLTIQKGVDTAQPGDTVYVRGGTYHEAVSFVRSGAAGSPITLAGYLGERPVIDGEYTLPIADVVPIPVNCVFPPGSIKTFVRRALVNLGTYDYLVLRNLEIMRSQGYAAVDVKGTDTLLEDLFVHDNRYTGIQVSDTQRVTVRNSTVVLSGDFATFSRDARCLNWGGGLVGQNTTDSTFTGNTVFHTWGEGIILMGCDRFVIEDNVSYDNYALNIYAEHSSNVLIQRNLAYHTGDATYLREGYPPVGIKITDEADMDVFFPPTQYSHDNRVLNNFVMGHIANFSWTPRSGGSGGLLNSVIANNTFVNATGVAINIGEGVHTNARIENNIILEDAGGLAQIDVGGVSFSYNLWPRTPPAAASGVGDVIGNPRLALTGPTGPGALLPDYFKLLSSSPAIDRAKVVAEVTDDFFRNRRGSAPDIGAHEFNPSAPGPPPTPTPTPTVTPTPVPGATATPTPTPIPGGTGNPTATPTPDSVTTTTRESSDPQDPEIDSNVGCNTRGFGGSAWVWILGLLGSAWGFRRRKTERVSFLVFFISAALLSNTVAHGATFYVSPSGSDTNSGTIEKPFGTIQKGLNTAVAGDTVYVRGGTYHQSVMFGRSGEEGNPITLAGYPGERPLLDGEYTLPLGDIVDTDPKTGRTTVSLPMIHFATQSHIVVRNFEIMRSHGAGIYASAHDNLIDDVWVHEVRTSGINIYNCQGNTVRNSRISETENWAPYSRSASTLNWGGGLVSWGCKDSLFQGNNVLHTWGEGIIVMGAERFVIEDNISFDNFGLQIYSEHSAFVTIQRNLVYNTGDPIYFRDGNPSEGILIADEPGMDQHFPDVYTHDIKVMNNLVTGGIYNFNWAGDLDGTTRWCWEPGDPGGLANSVVAYNTFLNAKGGRSNPTGIRIDGGVHTNARFENNIIVQETGQIAAIKADPAIHFSNNLWSRTPPASGASSNDIIGDPLLALAGPTGPGELLPEYFKLLENSPAIDRAEILTDVTDDFFRSVRGPAPDIGGHEFAPVTVGDKAVDLDYASNGVQAAGVESGCATKRPPEGGLLVLWISVLTFLVAAGRRSRI